MDHCNRGKELPGTNEVRLIVLIKATEKR